MNGTYSKQKKDHKTRNELVVIFGISIPIVLAFGIFSGIFADIHDEIVDGEKNRALIKSTIDGDTSCLNLAEITTQYQDDWNPPYFVQVARERMAELHC